MIADETILYSINVQDVQAIAEQELGRKLTGAEIGLVEDKLGDYIDWQSAIEGALNDTIANKV